MHLQPPATNNFVRIQNHVPTDGDVRMAVLSERLWWA